MKALLILIICLFTSLTRAAKKLTLAQKAEMDAQKLLARVKYIVSLNQAVFTNLDDNSKFTVAIRQPVPDLTKVFSIDVALHCKNSEGRLVDPPNFSMHSDRYFTYFTVRYEVDQLNDKYGCREIEEGTDYVGKICYFSLDYIGSEADMVLSTVDFSATVKLPKERRDTIKDIEIRMYP